MRGVLIGLALLCLIVTRTRAEQESPAPVEPYVSETPLTDLPTGGPSKPSPPQRTGGPSEVPPHSPHPPDPLVKRRNKVEETDAPRSEISDPDTNPEDSNP
jgi:hypothetical protein